MPLIVFLKNNFGTIAVASAVILLVGFLAFKLIKDKKTGAGGCSCGCSACPMSGKCPSQIGKKGKQARNFAV